MFFLADNFFSEMYIEQMTTFVSTLYRYVQVKLLKKKCICFPKKLYNDFDSLAYSTRIYNTYLENLIHCWAFKSLSLHPPPYRCVQIFFFRLQRGAAPTPHSTHLLHHHQTNRQLIKHHVTFLASQSPKSKMYQCDGLTTMLRHEVSILLNMIFLME